MTPGGRAELAGGPWSRLATIVRTPAKPLNSANARQAEVPRTRTDHYRRCYCRGEDGGELGTHCPKLADDRKHGSWSFAVDVATVDGKRRTMRRGGYPTKAAARTALDDVLARHGAGVAVDDRQTVAAYLTAWLAGKRHTLKPKTLHQYGEYVTKDLIPALGPIRLSSCATSTCALWSPNSRRPAAVPPRSAAWSPCSPRRCQTRCGNAG